jgi:hypothetical protein
MNWPACHYRRSGVLESYRCGSNQLNAPDPLLVDIQKQWSALGGVRRQYHGAHRSFRQPLCPRRFVRMRIIPSDSLRTEGEKNVHSFRASRQTKVLLSERQKLVERTSQEDRVEDKFGGNLMHFRRGMKTIPKDECVRVDPQISL